MSEMPPPNVPVHWDDLDEMCEGLNQWDLDFRRLARGAGGAELMQVETDRSRVYRLHMNLPVLQQGSPPPGMRVIGVLNDGAPPFTFRGTRLDHDCLLVNTAGAEIHAINPAGFDWLCFNLPTVLLDATADAMKCDRLDAMAGGAEVLRCAPAAIAAIRTQVHLICSGYRADAQVLTDPLFEQEMTGELSRLILLAAQSSVAVTQRDLNPARATAVQQAQHYIRDQSYDRISIPEMCQNIGVSERTLQYAFRARYGMTPKAYIRNYRLHQVRKQLRAHSAAQTSIQEIAKRCGFWHMGQFSADYRKLYGELPSQTLRRNP